MWVKNLIWKKKLYVNKKKYTLYRSKNNIIINCPYLFLSICVEFTYLFHFDFNFFLFSFLILNHSKLRWFFFHMQFWFGNVVFILTYLVLNKSILFDAREISLWNTSQVKYSTKLQAFYLAILKSSN